MSDLLEKVKGGQVIEAVFIEMVRNAMAVIRKQRTYFTTKAKLGFSGELDDVCTSADLAAQAAYTKTLRELFPDYGIIAEESDLRFESSPSLDEVVYFTIDPLDGTKAFIRSQSHGIGTMIALVRGSEVIASCIGNVMTQELYSQAPEDAGAWRIDHLNHRQPLVPKFEQPLSQQFALIRDRPEMHSTMVKRMLEMRANGGLCKSFQTADGSVGLSMARLWNGEVGLVVQPPTTETPWDATPIIGINQRLNILQLQQNDDGYFVPKPYRLITSPVDQDETIYLHRSHLEEFMLWQEKTFERFR